jgi:hypothetical protein
MTDSSDKGGRTLWIWVILAFLVLISAWTGLVVTAIRNQPEVIEIHQP